MAYSPIYSHGGGSVPSFNAVPGNVTGPGRPVSLLSVPAMNAIQSTPIMNIICTATSATVVLECNGGPVDATGNPPATDWIDVSNGGYSMTSGQTLSKRIPPTQPFWRTRITVINAGGGVVNSYIPVTPSCPASYPPLSAVTSEF